MTSRQTLAFLPRWYHMAKSLHINQIPFWSNYLLASAKRIRLHWKNLIPVWLSRAAVVAIPCLRFRTVTVHWIIECTHIASCANLCVPSWAIFHHVRSSWQVLILKPRAFPSGKHFVRYSVENSSLFLLLFAILVSLTIFPWIARSHLLDQPTASCSIQHCFRIAFDEVFQQSTSSQRDSTLQLIFLLWKLAPLICYLDHFVADWRFRELLSFQAPRCQEEIKAICHR